MMAYSMCPRYNAKPHFFNCYHVSFRKSRPFCADLEETERVIYKQFTHPCIRPIICIRTTPSMRTTNKINRNSKSTTIQIGKKYPSVTIPPREGRHLGIWVPEMIFLEGIGRIIHLFPWLIQNKIQKNIRTANSKHKVFG